MRALVLLAGVATLAACAASGDAAPADEWIPLFDGSTLDGWTASENPGTFTVRDGMIVVHGPRAHLFYTGPVGDHDFRNFEWKADVMTMPGANSGMYVRTHFQETGFPSTGYEIQVNNSHTDPKRTGSLYGIRDVLQAPARDSVWFTQDVTVQGGHVVVKVDGRTLVDYTEPEGDARPAGGPAPLPASGTVALQGHDPGSVVYYRNVMIRLLPD
jgi:hypothetical protein